MHEILKSTKYVVEHSNFVQLNQEKITLFADNFTLSKDNHWLMLSPINFFSLSEEEKLHFLFIFHSICFSFWGNPKWTVKYKNASYDGSLGMLVALFRCIEDGFPILDFNYLKKINKNDFAHFLKGSCEIPLFEERFQIIQEITQIINHKFRSKVINLIEETNHDAIKLLHQIIKNFPSFSDLSSYKEKTVYFYKRAQLLITDIYRIFNGKNFGYLKNMDQITSFADYKIPQILRCLDILQYSQPLKEIIDNKMELLKNSDEEIEIRANTIWAIELIKEKSKKYYPQLYSFQLNDQLWLTAQNSLPFPYHRTRTIHY